MSKSQTLSDLKKTGVVLSQADAQEIHSRLNEIAQGRHETGELFEPAKEEETKSANHVEHTNSFTPLSENKAPEQPIKQPDIVKEPKIEKPKAVKKLIKKAEKPA